MTVNIFEIPLSELTNRLDVVYYQVRNEVARQFDKIKAMRLEKLCKQIKTKTPARESYIEEPGIPCIKLRNVTGRILNVTNCDYIPESLKSKLVTAQKNDIIITATGEGTAGRVDIFTEPGDYIVTGENILLRPNRSLINPFYLLAMLRTDLLSKQLTHFVRGATGQTHLYWHDISSILIPIATDTEQIESERLFLEAWKKRRFAVELIQKAKQIVITSAGLHKVNIKKRDLTFETPFSKVGSLLRFDVEYFQPIHNRITELLLESKCIKADKIIKLNKSLINPRKEPTNTFNYVDISSIDTEMGDFEVTHLLGYEAPTRARRKPRVNDLIFSTVRPNRNAVAMIPDNIKNIVVSTGFGIITPLIDPLVVFVILKTEQVYLQLVRKSTAAMYPAVKPEDILNILVPTLLDQQVTEITNYLKESMRLRKESESLLDILKQIGERILESN